MLSSPLQHPPIHMWVFNTPFRGVTEQVEFFYAAVRAHGYPFSVSNYPSPKALNVIIENFDALSSARVLAYCRESQKRVAVVLTEHMDFVDGRILFHGVAIDSFDAYMYSATKRNRLLHLLTLREFLSGFLRLGDLPALTNMEAVLPGISIRTIPFPRISTGERPLDKFGMKPRYDLVFTGKPTGYRIATLASLEDNYTVLRGDQTITRHGDNFQSRRCRDAQNAAGKIVLNIPQRPNWPWVSTMRVIAALRCRRATATIGTDRNALIGPACLQIETPHVDELLQGALEDYEAAFETAFAAYEELVKSPLNPQFPSDFFDMWASLEL